MARKNFYLLLDLSIDPPETNPRKIEEALKKKQAQWSRERNHPTKGMLAKQYIGLIPEIRKVMADDGLRRKEAAEAKAFLAQQAREKLAKFDRHLKIMLGKGNITSADMALLSELHGYNQKQVQELINKRGKYWMIDWEIASAMQKGAVPPKALAKLSKKYGVDEAKLREWAKKKKDENIQEIDRYLAKSSSKGFVTESEIKGLSDLFGISKEDIGKRLKCPVKKDRLKKSAKTKPIDVTIEKIITENLKIVGKTSLYDFLDLPPIAGLEILQKKAKEKETAVRQIGQKDAVTTASAALAGHCIAIFKTNETRHAYDLSIIKSRIPELDEDINMAAAGGKISGEAFNLLVREGVKIGMDPDAAAGHVRQYSKERKWTIEESRQKKKAKFMMAAVVASVFILVVGGYAAWRAIQSSRQKSAYERVLANVEKQTALDEKVNILQDYIAYHKTGEYADEARRRLNALRAALAEQDYNALQARAPGLLAADQFEQASKAYRDYLQKHPNSGHAADIREKLADVAQMIENRDYKKVIGMADAGFDEKIQTYEAYLSKHPDGRYAQAVKQLIIDAADAYYNALKQRLADCERNKNWEECIRLCDQFLRQVDDESRRADVEGLKTKYENKIQYSQDIADMKAEAEKKGGDYYAAKRVFLEYLDANPEASSQVRDLIAREVALLDKKIAAQEKERKEWEDLLAYVKNTDNSITRRVSRLEKYVADNPKGAYIEDAKDLLGPLRDEKARHDERVDLANDKKAWIDVVAYVKDGSTSTSGRIGKVQSYLSRYPSGQYSGKAKRLLAQLNAQQAAEEERYRKQLAEKARIERETAQMRAYLKQSRRFVDNGDGTVTDRRTGLVWTLLDSQAELGRCVNYKTAQEYVQSLTTGGRGGWRLPTMNELGGIYKNKPFFPPSGTPWYWSSEMVVRGWNKEAVIVTTRQETVWKKQQVNPEECGAVRAVRR